MWVGAELCGRTGTLELKGGDSQSEHRSPQLAKYRRWLMGSLCKHDGSWW